MKMTYKGIPMTSTPPAGCSLAVGDVVTFTNDYGVKFKGDTITGFTLPEDELHGRTVYVDDDSYWFPVRPESLKVESTD